MKGWQVVAIDNVEVVYNWAGWTLTCTWPQRRSRSIETVVTVHAATLEPQHSDDGDDRTMAGGQRLVMSASRLDLHGAKTTLIRAMKAYDDDPVITEFVHEVAQDLLNWFRQSGATTYPTPGTREGDRWLLYPLWPSSMGTLVAAGTNSFKSLVAIGAAIQVTLGVDILSGNTRVTTTTPILYCDWEASEADFAERLYAVLNAYDLPIEPCVAYRHLRVPLADAAETLAEEIKRNGYGGVVVDSLSAACGGSLVDDELANHFWNAVAYLDVPVLVTAHKSAEKLARGRKGVFGSVMHENRSRMLWDAQRSRNEPAVRWEVVSDNNTGLKGNRLAWRLDINKEGRDENERMVALSFHGMNPNDLRLAANEGDTLADRVAFAIIEQGPLMAGEIASAVGVGAGSIRKVLQRHADVFDKMDDGRWGLVTGPVDNA